MNEKDCCCERGPEESCKAEFRPLRRGNDGWVSHWVNSEVPGEPDIEVKIRPNELDRLQRHILAASDRDVQKFKDRIVSALLGDFTLPDGVNERAFVQCRDALVALARDWCR